MAPQRTTFTTKELSKRTWADFERLFSQGNGWDHCWCMAYQGGNKSGARRADRSAINRADKMRFVEEGRAHGILVYAGDEPVGWCQFGSQDELPVQPRDDAREPREPSGSPLWRITCFVTHKQWQHQGVARTALRAALDAISEKGGGLVKAHPFAQATKFTTSTEVATEFAGLVRAYGRSSDEVKAAWYRWDGKVAYEAGRPVVVEQVVDGVGPVNALCRWWSPAFHVGTVAMFKDEGFKAIGKIEPSNRPTRERTDTGRDRRVHPTRVVMQKKV